MKKTIMLVEAPRRVGLLTRIKKSPPVQLLKSIGFVRIVQNLRNEFRFYLGFRKFDHGDEFKGYICKLPFEYAEIMSGGDISVCCYLPKNLGNINQNPFTKVWNSFFARKLRASMLDGSFSYCDKKKCRSMQNFDSNLVRKTDVTDPRLKRIVETSTVSLAPEVKVLALANDYSCNLKCPSCRDGMRVMSKNEAEANIRKFHEVLEEVGPKLETIHIAGDGDPFTSQFYHTIITKTDWKKYPQVRIGIQTNGTALTEKKWNSLPDEFKKRVTYIGISIDGATKDTYETLRLGGKFEGLMRNIEFLAAMPERKVYGIDLNLNMIVQQQNYREMPELVRLGEKLGVDKVGFTYLRDWGTYPAGVYELHAVHLPSHAEHLALVSLLDDPVFHHRRAKPVVDLGNLVHVMQEGSSS